MFVLKEHSWCIETMTMKEQILPDLLLPLYLALRGQILLQCHCVQLHCFAGN